MMLVETMPITAAQVRAARGLVAWSQRELAEAASVGLSTVADFERGKRTPIDNNLSAIERALAEAGVEFIDEDGVRRRARS